MTTNGERPKQPQPATEGAKELIRDIRRTLHGLVVATIIVFVGLAAVGVYAYTVSAQNRQAVCNLRTDLEQRVNQGEEFITNHPDSVRKLGFTIPQAQEELDNQRRTLQALSVVSC